MSNNKIIIIEPFYGGSHKQLIDLLMKNLQELNQSILYTLPAKKWHWRARVSALQLSQQISDKIKFDILFCSSVLNLSELCGLRSDLSQIKKKIIYFHENQLIYPVQNVKNRDFQYGYNQITSIITADIVLFNSAYNMNSFLNTINTFLNIIPDFKIKGIKELIKHKCFVLYYPIEKPPIIEKSLFSPNICHILWPHRWEHDKNPNLFFTALIELHKANIPFRLSVLGEQYSEIPSIFEESKAILSQYILNWGFIENKEKYYEILNDSDIVVSTADHEFFGVAMIEAALCGCTPICPNKLSYPEIFGEMEKNNLAHFYNTDNQLFKIIKSQCTKFAQGHWLKNVNQHLLFLKKFLWTEGLCDEYKVLFK